MIHSPQKLWLLITVCAAFGWSRTARPADMSAQMGALVHDVTAPYAEDHYPVSAKDREAYQKAREILRKEHFLGTARPATGTADLSAPYGKALALGTSVNKVLPQIAELHGAALHNDKAGMQSIIGAIYENIGRKVPQGDAMQKLIEAARGTAIADGVTNEEFTVKKPGYEIRNKYSPGSGKVQTDVRTTDGKGEPVRARFAGDLKGKPAPNGKDVQLVAQPEDKPKIVDSAESKKLAAEITGDWIDDEGKPWKIALQGSAITLTSTGINDHPVVYKGTYDLAQIRAEHKVDHPDDMLEDLPSPVKEELASSYHPPFNVDLEVSENADELDGTWTSSHVTYSGMTQSVSSIHGPWDKPLVLRRKKPTPKFFLYAKCATGLQSINEFYIGVPTLIEAQFDPKYDAEQYPLEVTFGEQRLTLVARKIDKKGIIFRTDFFVSGPSKEDTGPVWNPPPPPKSTP